ncbi:MAG: NAD-glutamate dehydrogenase domain-containing protein, partial [Alphaproteobacteria bacterium]
MATRADSHKQEQIGKAAELVRTKIAGDKADNAELFVREFYAGVLEDDIQGVEPEDLYGAALSLFQFAAKRPGGALKVRAYNPRFDKHGWRSRHTVIEIVNDDMPFLVDSVTMGLNAMNLTVHLVIHPILKVKRDKAGNVADIAAARNSKNSGQRESFMQIQVDEQGAPEALREIEERITQILGNVRAAVDDWRAMMQRVSDVRDNLKNSPPPIAKEELDEAIAFLDWIYSDNFTFIGFRDIAIKQQGKKVSVEVAPGSGLGILRDEALEIFEGLRRYGSIRPDVQEFLRKPSPILITKSSLRSTIHRPVPLDAIAVKKFDQGGNVVGEQIFVGLFTSVAYSMTARRIPALRSKVQEVMDRAGFDPKSHSGKALLHVLEHFPRDELFQIDAEQLSEIAVGIVNLHERQRIALFVRHDPFERFVSAFVYVPRERYNAALRRSFQDILAESFNGTILNHTAQFGDEPLGRLHFVIATQPDGVPEYDVRAIESRLREAGRTWGDRLHEALVDHGGDGVGNRLYRRYGDAFPVGYQERFAAATAVLDIEKIEGALAGNELGMNLYRPLEAEDSELRFKVYNTGAPLSLSDILPVLENMGLKVLSEVPYEIKLPDGRGMATIHDFAMVTSEGASVDFEDIHDHFQESFRRIWRGDMENDGFNRLVLGAELDWREIVVLRAFYKFLRQARIPFSQEYVEQTLARNPTLAALIAELFHIRCDPDYAGKRNDAEGDTVERILEGLESVSNLDEDRIIRKYLNLAQQTLRTNFFQPGEHGEPKSAIAFKFDSTGIDELPLPRPLREIFVYSPRFEGVHLRFGLVARGGLRWSDRREDFRTEVLGLGKAQQVKNAVIVPVGSKGGFVLKKAPPAADRDAFLKEGVAVYKAFVSALLDVTDNLVGDKVAPPQRVVRKDGDDPYLVVAADNGTATFSDFANEVARIYGFWLDDAFA